MEFVRQEYPRPQFERKEWENLNGEWTCHISRKSKCFRDSDRERGNASSQGFEQKINVPFAPETIASGLHEKEIIDTIWYQRNITIPQSWIGRRIILHFGAVFYHTDVFLDGVHVGFHDGGSSSFSLDITDFIKNGKTCSLVVKATANLQDGSIPSGKQSSYVSSYACFYQRTTGIWQTVWLECVDTYSLTSVRTSWNASESKVYFTPAFNALTQDMLLEITIDENKVTVPAIQGIPVSITISNPKLWEPEVPNLYEITYSVLVKGTCVDQVSSYIGLRTVTVTGQDTFINGKKLYYRFVLDQGFYPEGNWTAPSDKAMQHDIQLAQDAGFNGARLHQKVFEERFFYHADHMGYLVWGETPSWGLDYNDEGLPARNYLHELSEIVQRDVNHPSIIGWSPLNETWYFKNPKAHRRLHKEAYELVKLIDQMRPVNDASGYIHYITDLWTVHTYLQNPKELRSQLEMKNGKVFRNFPESESEYTGQPYLVDEYGGVKWDPSTQVDKRLGEAQNLQSWGYGRAPQSEEEFLQRVKELTDVLLSLPHISGYCYTQLTDVEQEKNGLYYYSRQPKFKSDLFRAIFSRKPDGYDL